jgi:hypothetical protein
MQRRMAILHSGGRCRHLITGGLGEGGVHRSVEDDPDARVLPVDPIPYVPRANLSICRECGQPRCEAPTPKILDLTGKVTTHSLWFDTQIFIQK